MNCPRCNLVHPPGEQVCRRCEIDLKTMEPRSRVVLAEDVSQTSAAERLKSRMLERSQKAPKREEIEPRGRRKKNEGQESEQLKQDQRRRQEIQAPLVTVVSDDGEETREEYGTRGEKARSIRCVQCGGAMEVQRSMPYSRAWPFALLGLGAVLAVAGLWIWTLFIPAAAAAVLGVVYMRVGKTYWKCDYCGYVIPRA